MTLITVFGSTGFLGRRIIARLTRERATLRVTVRHPDWVDTPTKSIGSGRTIPVSADVRDPSLPRRGAKDLTDVLVSRTR
jgi:uncharacterized protein YbjT (DUF2867 family)